MPVVRRYLIIQVADVFLAYMARHCCGNRSSRCLVLFGSNSFRTHRYREFNFGDVTTTLIWVCAKCLVTKNCTILRFWLSCFGKIPTRFTTSSNSSINLMWSNVLDLHKWHSFHGVVEGSNNALCGGVKCYWEICKTGHNHNSRKLARK